MALCRDELFFSVRLVPGKRRAIKVNSNQIAIQLAHPRCVQRHTWRRNPGHVRIGKQLVDGGCRYMPFDNLAGAGYHGGVARAQLRWYAQLILDGSHVGRFDGFDIETGIPHMLDPTGTATAVRVLIDGDGLVGSMCKR